MMIDLYKNFGSNLLKTMTEAMGSYRLYIDIDKRCNDELLRTAICCQL